MIARTHFPFDTSFTNEREILLSFITSEISCLSLNSETDWLLATLAVQSLFFCEYLFAIYTWKTENHCFKRCSSYCFQFFISDLRNNNSGGLLSNSSVIFATSSSTSYIGFLDSRAYS